MRPKNSFAAGLESLLGALVTPWEFASIDHWRDQVAVRARDAVAGQVSQVSLDPVCGLAPMRSPDADPALVAEYQRDWIHRDPFRDLIDRHALATYVRSDVVQQMPDFGALYAASPIVNDFYRRAALHDAAGVLRRHPHYAQLTVFTSSRTNPRFARRARRVVPLAAPAFLSGARQILNLMSIRGHFARNIDAIRTPVALYDIDGAPLHRNTALDALLTSIGDASALVDVLDGAARTFARVGRGPAVGIHLAEATAGAMRWHWRDLCVSGSLARLGIEGSTPLVMLQVTAARDDAGLRRVDAATDARVAALTTRERQVGALLARGATNRAIADHLGITEHTARRHTERVLRKLGVTSRASVAGALGLLRDDTARDA